tara:strand:- start:1022 stop:1636 length:615 start_codon:yes stop_codon:yes gene_type:complete
MQPPKEQTLTKSEATRLKILDAAAFVLARKGYAGTRLDDIARVAEMKAGSLYYYFSSREDLVTEVMSIGVNQTSMAVSDKLNALPQGCNSGTRLRTALEAHLLCLIELNDYARANSKLNGQVPKSIQLQHNANEAKYGKLWRKLFRDLETSGTVRSDINFSAIRMFTLGAMAWAVEWYRPENGSPEKLARDFSTFVLDGLRRPD